MDIRHRSILKITIWGVVVNVFLTGLKFLAGVVGNSGAMVADAIHSLSDIITDMVVLVFLPIFNKPSDKDHHYGHGKYETLASIIVSLFLAFAGIGICKEGIVKIWDYFHGIPILKPGKIAFYLAIASIIVKELMYWATIIVGKKYNSSLIIANAWHHRSDAFSSIGVALGIAGAMFLGDSFLWLDPLAAIIVGIFIIKIALQIFKPNINELLEKSLPMLIQQDILSIVQSVEGVQKPHRLRTRKIGTYYAIDLHIYLSADMTIQEGHDIVLKVEERLQQKYPQIQLNIHVDPYPQEKTNAVH